MSNQDDERTPGSTGEDAMEKLRELIEEHSEPADDPGSDRTNDNPLPEQPSQEELERLRSFLSEEMMDGKQPDMGKILAALGHEEPQEGEEPSPFTDMPESVKRRGMGETTAQAEPEQIPVEITFDDGELDIYAAKAIADMFVGNAPVGKIAEKIGVQKKVVHNFIARNPIFEEIREQSLNQFMQRIIHVHNNQRKADEVTARRTAEAAAAQQLMRSGRPQRTVAKDPKPEETESVE